MKLTHFHLSTFFTHNCIMSYANIIDKDLPKKTIYEKMQNEASKFLKVTFMLSEACMANSFVKIENYVPLPNSLLST